MKFWEDEDEVEGPAELYSVPTNTNLDREWSYSAGNDQIYGRLLPKIYDGNLFYINSLGNLSALDVETGNSIWNKETNDIVSSGLDVNFKTVTYSTLDGFLVALDHKDGQELWRSQTSSEGLSPPANSGSHIILQTVDGRVSGYSLKTGKLDWFHQTVLPSLTLRGTSSPFIDKGFIFTGFANGKVAMIYPDSGAIRLELPVTINEGKSELERIVDVDGKPVIANELLIAASYQGNIMAINLRDGRPAWQEELSTVKDLAVNGSRVIAVDDQGILKAFGTATGAIIWEQEDLKLRKLTSPVSIRNLVAVGDYEGYIHLLNAQNGNFEGRRKVSRNALLEIVSDGNDLIVVDSTGRIQKFTTN
tara:strand:- start:409 stop:1494 length:1086 start_codon:yes stop_codon:yes gene_type:complete